MSQETTPKTKPAKPLEAGLEGLRAQVKAYLISELLSVTRSQRNVI